MRRAATVVIQRDGRDKGGAFVLKEMAAVPASEWFARAMMLLVRSGADVPPNIMAHGAAGFITMGLGTVLTGLGKAPWSEAKPLLDQLLACVESYQPPGGAVPLNGWGVISGQIEEAATIFQLYEEVLSLHLGFSLTARLLQYRGLVTSMMTAGVGPNTETSTQESAPSSPAALPA